MHDRFIELCGRCQRQTLQSCIGGLDWRMDIRPANTYVKRMLGKKGSGEVVGMAFLRVLRVQTGAGGSYVG